MTDQEAFINMLNRIGRSWTNPMGFNENNEIIEVACSDETPWFTFDKDGNLQSIE